MKAVVPALVASLAAAPAHALYCNNTLVSDGDHLARVRSLCGEPLHINRYVVYEVQEYTVPHRALRPGPPDARYPRVVPYEIQTIVPIEIQEWTYNFGPERFLHRITFQNGYLRQVDTSGYGF